MSNRKITANVAAITDRAALEILFLADAIRHQARTGQPLKAFQSAYARELQTIRPKDRPTANNVSDLHRFHPLISQVDPE